MIWRIAFGVALSAVALSACGSAAHKATGAASTPSRLTTATRRSQSTGATGASGTTGTTGSTSNGLSYVPVKPTNGPTKSSTGSPAANAAKNGDITISGTGPRVYGPFKFRSRFYNLTYRQFSRGTPVNFRDIATIFTVTLDRKPGVFDANSLSAVEANQPRGTASVAPGRGQYYVRVGSAAASYSLRFSPSP